MGLDFVTDTLASARHVWILTVVDVFTRECLPLETDTSMGSLRVLRVLDRLIAERGTPHRFRSDNGPEFTSRAYLAWSLERRIELVHIRPGKPIENAHVESCNGRFREECLNVSWFRNLFGARRQIETWRDHYNTDRPHSSLGYRTPEEFAALSRAAGQFSADVGQGISNPLPHPRSGRGCSRGELSYARINGFGGKVTRTRRTRRQTTLGTRPLIFTARRGPTKRMNRPPIRMRCWRAKAAARKPC